MNDNLDNFGQQAPKRKKSDPDMIWNLLTIMALVSTLCVGLYYYSLFSNPYSNLNPFPPNTLVPTPVPPTWTPIGFAATWTPTVTVPPTVSNTPRPTYTLEPSNTPFSLATATSVLTATRTPKPTGVPYTATVSYYDSTTFRTDTSCNTLLIAGQVLDSGNNPVIGLIVKMGGSLPGKVFVPPDVKLTGIATAYGPSGFEFDPGVQPVASSKSLWVQLYDQSSAPLSNQIFLTTYTDCKKNLVFIRFQQK